MMMMMMVTMMNNPASGRNKAEAVLEVVESDGRGHSGLSYACLDSLRRVEGGTGRRRVGITWRVHCP